MTKTLKKNKQVLIAGLVLVALVIAYFKREDIKSFFRKTDKLPSSNAIVAINNKTPQSSNNTNDNSILSNGSTGAQVRKLQQLLNDKHKQSTPTFTPLLVEDGKFGNKTEAMLKKYTGKTSISINQLIKALL